MSLRGQLIQFLHGNRILHMLLVQKFVLQQLIIIFMFLLLLAHQALQNPHGQFLKVQLQWMEQLNGRKNQQFLIIM
ncbi:MAG TPA: hypothetical protein DDW17_00880 [Deltaproteobacteria bacterium]|nr:hypothetical protein [Deltaproteobacteria bacterium]